MQHAEFPWYCIEFEFCAVCVTDIYSRCEVIIFLVFYFLLHSSMTYVELLTASLLTAVNPILGST